MEGPRKRVLAADGRQGDPWEDDIVPAFRNYGHRGNKSRRESEKERDSVYPNRSNSVSLHPGSLQQANGAEGICGKGRGGSYRSAQVSLQPWEPQQRENPKQSVFLKAKNELIIELHANQELLFIKRHH